MSQKTIERLHFYYRTTPEGERDGKKIYAAWPKMMHTDPKTAIAWAGESSYCWETRQTRHNEAKMVELENRFSDVVIPTDPAQRWYTGSKIPQALIGFEGGWLLIDFRLDGLLELLQRSGVRHANPREDLSIRYAGSNYYLVPTMGTSFQQFRKEFEKTHAPKTQKNTPREVGAVFEGSYGYKTEYLGQFDVENRLGRLSPREEEVIRRYFALTAPRLHVYRQVTEWMPRYSAQKTPMKSKGEVQLTPDERGKLDHSDTRIQNIYVQNDSYWARRGWYACVRVDLENRRIIIQKGDH